MMRLAQPRVANPTGLLAANYIVCTLTALILAIPELPNLSGSSIGFPAGLGAVNGFIYLAGFALMQWSTRHNGVVLSSIFMKLGILVSMVISIVWFRELPTVLQAAGFFLAVAAIVIINYSKGTSLSRSSWVLLLMLCMSGMGDVMSKVYEVYGDAGIENLFLFFTFASALVLCLALMAYKKERLGIGELGYGALLGIPNFFSSLFLLKALGSVPGVIAFPTYSVGTILVVALAGLLIFREKLEKKQIAGSILICIALILLNL
jgi:drug/metabolite transporter (DMT)-like permease